MFELEADLEESISSTNSEFAGTTETESDTAFSVSGESAKVNEEEECAKGELSTTETEDELARKGQDTTTNTFSPQEPNSQRNSAQRLEVAQIGPLLIKESRLFQQQSSFPKTNVISGKEPSLPLGTQILQLMATTKQGQKRWNIGGVRHEVAFHEKRKSPGRFPEKQRRWSWVWT